eukprot:8538675-Pyramimonas_sp.AAC.1
MSAPTPQFCPREPGSARRSEGLSPRVVGQRIQRAQADPHHELLPKTKSRHRCPALVRLEARAIQERVQDAS